jgi:hypothetical protein
MNISKIGILQPGPTRSSANLSEILP